MNTRIYYEYWQMSCFNNPFKIGDSVEWPVVAANDKNCPLDVGPVDYCFKAHNENPDGLYVLTGFVKDISVVYEKYEVVQDGEGYQCLMHPDILEIRKIDSSVLSKEAEKPDFMAAGYIVEMKGVTIRKAESSMNKEEVLSKTQTLMEKAIPGAFGRNQDCIADILNMHDEFVDGLIKIDFTGKQVEIFFCERGKTEYSYHTDNEDKVIFALLDYLIDYDVRNSLKEYIAESVANEQKCKDVAEYYKEKKKYEKRLIDEAFERVGAPYNTWHKTGMTWVSLKSYS